MHIATKVASKILNFRPGIYLWSFKVEKKKRKKKEKKNRVKLSLNFE